MLQQKSRYRLVFTVTGGVLRKKPTLSDAPPATHHDNIDTGGDAIVINADIVGTGRMRVFGKMFGAHDGKRPQTVTQSGGGFKFFALGGFFHIMT